MCAVCPEDRLSESDNTGSQFARRCSEEPHEKKSDIQSSHISVESKWNYDNNRLQINILMLI